MTLTSPCDVNFLRKIGFDIPCKLSPKRHERSKPIFWGKIRKIFLHNMYSENKGIKRVYFIMFIFFLLNFAIFNNAM